MYILYFDKYKYTIPSKAKGQIINIAEERVEWMLVPEGECVSVLEKPFPLA